MNEMPSNAQQRIAVIIPFYKLRYFRDVLQALTEQSDQSFTVYVGNDASDKTAEAIVDGFRDRLDIRYHRFQENLGGQDLAAQWNRCVALTSDEDWIWVLPDDDLPSCDCVEDIRRAIDLAEEVGANIIHVPGITIDSSGHPAGVRAVVPAVMSAADHYLSQLRGEIGSMSLASSVYRRRAFDAAGQFLSLPRGWGSDHATPLAVAKGGPFVTVEKASFGFRMSGENISSMTHDAEQKMQARTMFIRFISANLGSWCDADVAKEIRWRVFSRSEIYATIVWPFTWSTAKELWRQAEICGVPRSTMQKFAISVRGLAKLLQRRLESRIP